MKKSLLALAVGTFALGIAEFGMMGILGDVARNLNISISTAGNLISAYSTGVAVGAPLLLVLRRMPLRRLMALFATVIMAGNLFTALAPGYTTMLIARFIAGLPHGAYFGAGAIVCSRLASKGAGAEAVAVMVGGMTVANLIGVPGATYVCNALSWRWAFIIVAFCAAMALIGIRSLVPPMAPIPDTGFKGQFRFLSHPAPWLIYGAVFFGQGSVYCWLSYIEPIMTRLTGFPQGAMTWIMMVVGLGMVTGNALAGRIADRHGVARVCGTLCASMLIVMPAIYFCAPFKTPSVILAFAAAAALFGIGGPLQYLIVRFAKGGEMLGGAGIQIAFNVSNAVAALIGGMAIHAGWGIASPALIGIPFAAVGTTCLILLNRHERQEQTT